MAHSDCCGCMACGDVCPKGAITFKKDIEGFLYPDINKNCIDCGLCRQVCPVVHNFDGCVASEQKYIGCLDKDKQRRKTGSSGGLFGLLAMQLMSEGYVVVGAAFDENLKLKHQIANSPKELERLKKSKYLQSDCGGIYREIKEHIAKDGKIMFVGTPCQCAALKQYLGKKLSNVILVDFACHGVPSQDLFDKCISYDEQKLGGKIKSYSFRYKSQRYGSPQDFSLLLEKGNKLLPITGKYYEEPFYCGFQKYITLRPSCYHCKWAKEERISDITLADFWGIEEATNKWDRTAHPSLVILNTEKGRQLFEKIKPEIDFFEASKESAVKGNGSLIVPTKRTQARDDFFVDLRTAPFSAVVKKHLTVRRAWMKDVYYAIPFPVRKRMLNILNKR